MNTPAVLKLDNDTYFEMPLLKDYLADYEARLMEDSLENASVAINKHSPSVIVTGSAFIGKDIIDLGLRNSLRGIVKAGTGLDNVDVAYARSKGVVVANIPAYAAETVAEYAVTFMLSLVRKLWPLQQAMRQKGGVSATPAWLGRELYRKTIGLIGFGQIARRVARITHFGFEMPVLAYDPYVSAEEMAKVEVEKVEELEQLLSQSDIVSIHSLLNSSTLNMIGAEQLSVMKPSALLINVSRGGIIDEEALLKALLEHQIDGAALDVYSKEPLDITTHPILSQMASMENVLLSSHIAWYTVEAGERLQKEVGQRCIDIIREKIR
jgi:D-3-phosphoglycerate dehydrogenase